MELYSLAWNDLHTERYERSSPIPWRRIVEWSRYYGLDEVQESRVLRYIRHMDNVFLQWVEKKMEVNNK